MKLVVFAASNSNQSINKVLATYAASLLDNVVVNVLDLNDYELPIFGEDKEREIGQPKSAKKFLADLGEGDAIIVSFAEHNYSYSAAYKNLFDWCSRINIKIYQNKPMVLLSASPGHQGCRSVLAAAMSSASHFGGVIKGSFYLQSFYENFDMENNKINDSTLLAKLKKAVENLNT